jgi:hypothetical protein
MPRATIDGDRVRLTGVRNFDYRSRNDFTASLSDRASQLDMLVEDTECRRHENKAIPFLGCGRSVRNTGVFS